MQKKNPVGQNRQGQPVNNKMSGAGPSRMYAQQAVAYSVRDSMLGAQTNSTAESPPTQNAPDIAGLCELKRSIGEPASFMLSLWCKITEGILH